MVAWHILPFWLFLPLLSLAYFPYFPRSSPVSVPLVLSIPCFVSLLLYALCCFYAGLVSFLPILLLPFPLCWFVLRHSFPLAFSLFLFVALFPCALFLCAFRHFLSFSISDFPLSLVFALPWFVVVLFNFVSLLRCFQVRCPSWYLFFSGPPWLFLLLLALLGLFLFCFFVTLFPCALFSWSSGPPWLFLLLLALPGL